MKISYAQYLLKKTKDDYNRIAPVFSMKRSYLTEDVKVLKKYSKNSDKVLDLGCGNGRLSELFSPSQYVGADNSEELIKIAKEKYKGKAFIQIKDFKLPFRKESFDVVYSLAVLHHLPSKKLRSDFLKEAGKVLKPEGKMVITVWNLWKIKQARKLIYKEWLKKIFLLSRLDFNDIFYPFKDLSGKVIADRYLHCFTKKELIKLLEDSGYKVIESGYLTRGKKIKNENIFIVAHKP